MANEDTNQLLSDNNSVFVLLPFVLTSRIKMNNIVQILMDTGEWTEAEIRTKFMYKYVTQKLFCKDSKYRKCFILEYSRNSLQVDGYSLYTDKEISICPSSSLGGLNCASCNFIIDSIKLIAFSSNICMLAFNLHFLCKSVDYKIVSNSLYFLKKISDGKFRNTSEESSTVSWITLSKALLQPLLSFGNHSINFDLNYYSEEKYARANFFVSIIGKNNGTKNEYDKALYYLKHGFTEKYDYIPSKNINNYYAPNGRKWGISYEGCACILTTEHQMVIRKQLSEFRNEYFLMYCLLLHQKYFYYKLLMQVGNPKGNSLHELKKYKSDLINFESDFVFSTITEVPQYQGVHEMFFSQLQLSNLCADVKGPIVNLNNNKIEKNEKIISLIGFFVSLLGIFSILADGYFIVNLFLGECIAFCFVKGAFIVSLIALLVFSIVVIIRQFYKNNKEYKCEWLNPTDPIE